MINGIQQMGIGTPSVQQSWKWYRKNLGFDTPVFNEAAEAPLMTQYTGNKVQSRHAILAMNLNGGGGMEIWQYTSRVPQERHPFSLLQQGFLVTLIKCQNAREAKATLKDVNSSGIEKNLAGKDSFSFVDPFGNPFIAAESEYWYQRKTSLFGGIEGAVVGVRDMKASIRFYAEVLGIDRVAFDQTAVFEDFKALQGGNETFRRVRLSPSKRNNGAFSEVFGDFFIDLIQPVSAEPSFPTLKDRFWGDQGYIHLCFDVNQMNEIKSRAARLGHPFTIDSGETFSMGEAAGRFAYLEDPDGALIELVETERITIAKKFKWYLTLTPKRKSKPLPRILFSIVGLNRQKD